MSAGPSGGLRVLVVVPRYLPHLGGIENHVHAIARRLVADGHDVLVATQVEDEGQATTDLIDGVAVRRFPSGLPLFGQGISPALWRAVRGLARDADVVHVHNVHAVTTLGVLWALPVPPPVSPPVVVTPHYLGVGAGTAQRVMHALYDPPLARRLRRAAAVVCTSRAEAVALQADLRVAADRVHVVPNGIDRSVVDAAVPVDLPGRLVVTAGRLEPYKQHDRVLTALPHTDLDVRLAIAGEGPALPALRALAASLDVADRVHFLGRLVPAELARWYRAASVVASLSTRESYGLTLVEGLAAGAAVVASDIPPHREVVEDAGADAGVLIPVDSDPAAVGSALTQALALPRGVARVWDWDQVTKETLALYETVLSVPGMRLSG